MQHMLVAIGIGLLGFLALLVSEMFNAEMEQGQKKKRKNK